MPSVRYKTSETVDFIVIGAGAAGGIQAGNHRAVFVEHGAVLIDHQSAHGVGDPGTQRHRVKRRHFDRPRLVAVRAAHRREAVRGHV